MANEATERLIAAVAMVNGTTADALWARVGDDGPRNMIQMSLHPDGLRAFVVNVDEVVVAILSRLAQEALDHVPSARLREVDASAPCATWPAQPRTAGRASAHAALGPEPQTARGQ